MNRYQAQRVLNTGPDSSQNEIKAAYRRLVLEVHPDKSQDKNKDEEEFKKITEAYNILKDDKVRKGSRDHTSPKDRTGADFKGNPQWGAPKDKKTPEQDWGKYTREFEEGDPDFWKEYERKFWEDYNAKIRADGKNGEFDKAKEPKRQPNLFVDVDKSLCIGCCSCEIIAPEVFQIDKEGKFNPKSTVIDQKGAGVNKIMNAAETCPTKAIIVEDTDSKERLYPY